MTKYIVQCASAKMPSRVKSPYRRVAVLEVHDGLEGPASMISTHSRDVVRVIKIWDRLHQGRSNGPNTAYQLALVDAEILARRLNGVGP